MKVFSLLCCVAFTADIAMAAPTTGSAGMNAAQPSPSPISTTEGSEDSTAWGTAPAPKSTTSPSLKGSVVKNKEGTCAGYCGIAFCECGPAVGCRNGVFGCGYQAGNPSKECYCDVSCEKDGSCCADYFDECTAGGISVTEQAMPAPSVVTKGSFESGYKSSPPCLQRCGDMTCGDVVEAALFKESPYSSCGCAKCQSVFSLEMRASATDKPMIIYS